MIVQSIQNTTGTAAVNTSNTESGSEDFSSYLNTECSLDDIFKEASETYNVPINLLKAIAKAESNFDPNATSGAGAQGIMQLMPATARSLGVTDSYDPYQNIMGGAKYISMMLERYDGNVTLSLAAYNAGSGNVAKYGGVPPFEETQNYVAKVTAFMNEGVSVPEASYPSLKAASSSAAADVEAIPEDYYRQVLDELFSYEDYLHFLDLYIKLQELQRSQNQKEQDEAAKEQDKKADSFYSYQEIRYNPAVMNLISQS